MHATGAGVNYRWTTEIFINDTNSSDPIVYPITNTLYTAKVTDQFGCLDTLLLNVTVHPDAVLDLGDAIVNILLEKIFRWTLKAIVYIFNGSLH